MTFGANLRKARKAVKLTQQEVADELAVKKSTVCGWEKGYRSPRKDQIIRLATMYQVSADGLFDLPSLPDTTPAPEVYPVPVIGTIRCGFGGMVHMDYDETKMTEMSLLNSHRLEDYYWLIAKGDSMTDAGIHEGDYLLICRESNVPSGTIAVVAIGDEEATVKKVIKKPNLIILQPENRSYEPEVFVGEEMNTVLIIAEVIEVRKVMKRRQ